MDCPPDKESLSIFITTANILSKNPLWKTPTIFAQDDEQGFALIENFGERTFDQIYQENPQQSHRYIDFALQALIGMQQQGSVAQLSHYDQQQLQAEMDLFIPWFVEKLCAYTLTSEEQKSIAQCQQTLIKNMLAQPQVVVHRDYHCRNLLLTEGKKDALLLDGLSLGIIDFQDAVNGALCYDAVSLLKDCYWRLQEQQQKELLKKYWQRLQGKITALPNWQDFQKDYHYSGIQRHLKVLGIFARLALAYDKPKYLDDMSLVLWHLLGALETEPNFHAMTNLIKKLAPLTKSLQTK